MQAIENYLAKHLAFLSLPRRSSVRRRFSPAPRGYFAPVAEFKPSYLIQGLPGHPLHPPLTDATIGTYTFATAAAVLSKLGVAEHGLGQAWWLALVVGLVITVLDRADRACRLAADHPRQRALEDRDAAPDGDGHRNRLLLAGGDLRPRLLHGA